ncbi:hypothetical protein [Hahella ganghwensis]|uniref:hypothetical protein n=1 Tax=Hahella ganghwensis TaxID=286420 RepID=UPI000382D492|nr:hypothetical protein [Hahella ganghwensis]
MAIFYTRPVLAFGRFPFLSGVMLAMSLNVEADDRFWVPLDTPPEAQDFPFFAVALNADELREHLRGAPEETSPQGLKLTLPLPDRRFTEMEAFYSPVMAPELAEKFPQIRTYKVKGLDLPTLSGRIDFTNAGFKAFLTTEGQSILIEPEKTFDPSAHQKQYRVFFKRDLPDVPRPINEGAQQEVNNQSNEQTRGQKADAQETDRQINTEEASRTPSQSSAQKDTGFLSRLWRSLTNWF